MEGISKQQTGFRFGKHPLVPCEILGVVKYNGRTYRIQRVLTSEGKKYVALRLYNSRKKFIKQFLIDPEIVSMIGKILLQEGGIHGERRDREIEEDRFNFIS